MKKKLATIFVLALLFCVIMPLNTAFAAPANVMINSGNEGSPFDLTTMTAGQSLLVNTTEIVELTGNGGDITITCIAGAQVTLIDVTILSSGCPIAFQGIGNTLNLEGTSTLNANDIYTAVNVPSGAQLTILGTGTLTATGGSEPSWYRGGAGIGGSNYESSGEIVIKSGNINAIGGILAAGIGGSRGGDGHVTILGGNVKATGGTDASCIGGGNAGCGYINISGGRVETIPIDGSAAGIGNGYGPLDPDGEVNISGGLVIAKGGWYTEYNESTPGIGSATTLSRTNQFGAINITGGQVYAIAGDNRSEDIGASFTSSSCSGINISGSAAVFMFYDNAANLTTITATNHTHVNSETVSSNTAYGFDNFPDEFNGRVGYGYLKEATITYNYSDVSQPDSTITVWCGNELTEPSAPTKLGYTFNGWHYDIAGKIPYIFDGTPVSGDLTLYAHWVESGTHSGSIAGSLVDDTNSPIEGYYATLQSRPITVSTSSAGAFAFGSVYYINHTLIIRDDAGTLIRTYSVNFVEGTTPSAVVDEGSSTITVVYNGNVTGINIPLRLDASGTTATVAGPVTFTETSSSGGGYINPQTGDSNSNNYLYVIVSAISTVLLIGILIKKKTLA